MLLDDEKSGPPMPGSTVKSLGDGRFSVTVPMSRESLERIAWGMYGEGKTHEEVTAWLEEHCPRFRELLVEVLGDVGGKEMTVWAHTGRRTLYVVEMS